MTVTSRSFHATFRRLWPTEGPSACWLFELAILHDDLSFEMEQLKADELWIKNYFLRRATISLSEAGRVFTNLSDEVFRDATGQSDLAPLRALRKEIQTVAPMVERIRHRVGAHLDVSNVPKGEKAKKKQRFDAMNEFLEVYADVDGLVTMSNKAFGTSYRSHTQYAIFSVWHDRPNTENDIMSDLLPIADACGKIVRIIELIVLMCWKHRRALPGQKERASQSRSSRRHA